MFIQHYNLAEHHLYGSSRLGVKGYWPNQLYSAWDYSGATPVIDTMLFRDRKPWYSAEYQDGIKNNSLTPYGNVFTTSTTFQHLIGQKQYEATDHLGNVVITASDKKYALENTTDSLITGYRPELPATYDYYPFGMLMPGRYTQDTATHCANITQTIFVPQYSYYDLSPQWNTGKYPLGLATISNLVIGGQTVLKVSCPSENSGVVVNIPNVAVNQQNTHQFNVSYLSSEAQYIAQVFEYNIDDTILLAEKLIDRDGEYTINYKPNGTGIIKVNYLLRRGFLNDNVVYIKNIKTTLTGYIAQQVTTSICSGGSDKYRFGLNGAEKDNEVKGTGNSLDFGARMYDSRIARWLSLDPFKKKYTAFSPFNFAVNNPIVFVDADGRDIYVFGPAACKAIEQLQMTTSLKIEYNLDDKGSLMITGIPNNAYDEYLLDASSNPNIQIQLYTTNSNNNLNTGMPGFDASGWLTPGSYGGNYIKKDDEGTISAAKQYFNPNHEDLFSKYWGPGGAVKHELIEAYIGAKEALRTGKTVSWKFSHFETLKFLNQDELIGRYNDGIQTIIHKKTGESSQLFNTNIPFGDNNADDLESYKSKVEGVRCIPQKETKAERKNDRSDKKEERQKKRESNKESRESKGDGKIMHRF